jgi:3-hydroxyisobutyrate dehydrogenase-like beta-hydroxyacid dehydrogenase
MQLGWIGLGSVGAKMVAAALARGHEVAAYARGVGQDAAARAGARLVKDYRAIAEACEVLGVCVFSDAQLKAALIESGALAALRPGAVVAVHTTGSPKLARELGGLAPKGVEILDACFSGSAEDAARGELTLMVGGTQEALERARPALSAYASRIHLVGPLGSGQTLKLLNNLLFAANLRNAAEIIGLARSQGLDPVAAAKVIQASSGASMTMGLFVDAPPEQILEGARPYMTKDVRAAEAAARDAGLDLSSFRPVLDYFS